MVRLCLVSLLLFLVACAPATKPATQPPVVANDPALYQQLVAPFEEDLGRLGITLTNYRTYRYEGSDPNGFITAINTFYQAYSGFCPLTEAFYAAPSGTQFMTVASDNGTQVRAFVYDQSRRPRLIYAYVEGVSQQPLPAVVCETVGK